jgi:hypothetical protein
MRVVFFVALLTVSMLMTRSAQADIRIPIYTNPSFMRAHCQEELQQGRAGFCAGFVFATIEHLSRAGEVCRPLWAADEDALRIAIQRLDGPANGLRNAWPCKR